MFVLLLGATIPLLIQAADFTGLKGSPDLRSASALVTSAEGQVIYGKDIDTVRSIASITKLMTVMVILDSGLDLEQKISVSKDDRDLVQLTGSRLDYGATLSRREMIMIAIMSSENRAATALGRSFPGGISAFVAEMNNKAAKLGMTHSHFSDPAGLNVENTSTEMNNKAAKLGMTHSHFSDPAGLNVENTSTARDLINMVNAAQAYPLITKASTTTQIEVHPYTNRGPLVYNNTNRLLKNGSWDIAVSKTGYINEAGRCLVMQANIKGKQVSIVLLNSFGKLTPFGDSNRLRQWLLAGS